MLDLPYRFNFCNQAVAWGCMGEGEPLVLIHGTPFCAQVWRKIAPLLAKRWKVYFYDLLGYGLSEKKADQDVSLGVQNKLLSALFEEWGLSQSEHNQPEVLCHDFGGTTALRGYYLEGLRYKRLTIIDPVAIAPWGSEFVQHVRHYEEAFAGLPSFAHDALLTTYLQSSSHTKLDDDTLKLYMKPWQGDIGQAAFYRQIAQMDQRYTDELEALYKTMEIPIQILWGEEDQWIPISQGEKFAQRVANGQLTRVPRSGHLMQEDAPEAIIAAMLN